MKFIFLISTMGAMGVLARYSLVSVLLKHFPHFPMGTVVVNILGSFLIGLLVMSSLFSNEIKMAIIAGLLGGFTTFSSFSLELVQFFNQQQYGKVFLYGMGSPLLGFLATLAGMWLRKFLAI